MKLVVVDKTFNNERHLVAINLDSSFIDVILLTNLIFLASKLEIPTLNII